MKNKGFTLIEMIVTIAIMAVAMTVAGYSLAYIRNTRTKECAEKLNSAIELTRTAGMSRSGSVYLNVYRKDDGIYTYKSWIDEEEKIGSSFLKVQYRYTALGAGGAVVNANAELGTLASGDFLHFEFLKSSGAFKSPAVSGGQIVITISGSKTYTITGYPLTGKTTLE